jgi:hypothetical protein
VVDKFTTVCDFAIRKFVKVRINKKFSYSV